VNSDETGATETGREAKGNLLKLSISDLVTIVRGNSMMKRILGFYVALRESSRGLRRAQTMSEYALILAGVAIVVFVAYQTMGQAITGMVEWGAIHNDLTSS
jgi:Flp pilus assembly pilin Flp